MGVRYFGASVRRLEDPKLITGRGQYLDDLKLPGSLHAAFVRSPHAHARIAKIEKSAAQDVPGVVAVLTLADFGAAASAPIPPVATGPTIQQGRTQYPLARDAVCYVGEAVALVI